MKLTVFFFSPGGSTSRIADAVACGTGISEVVGIDLSPTINRRIKYRASYGELVIFAVPVYHGRIPEPVVDCFKNFSAAQSPAVVITNCGGQVESPALSELCELASAQGFSVIAAAEFISRHLLSDGLNAERPNENDFAAALELGKQIVQKLAVSAEPVTLPPFTQPPAPFSPAVAIATTGDCNDCKECARRCPVNAIDPDDPTKTDKIRCLSCMRCVLECPQKAKKPAEDTFSVAAKRLALLNREQRAIKKYI